MFDSSKIKIIDNYSSYKYQHFKFKTVNPRF